MLKYILTLTAALGLTMSAQAGNYNGVDGNGNYYWGHTDRDGNYNGVDGNGNYQWGHTDRDGNYHGVDGNGNYYWGHADPN